MILNPSLRGRLLAAIAFGAVFGAYSEDAIACSVEPLIGTVCTMAIKYCPKGYLPADGRMLDIRTNQSLYALIGTTYGGDGKTKFKLPDLRGRVAVGTGFGATIPAEGDPIPLKGVALGEQRGTEPAPLTFSQLPQHTHTAAFTGILPGNTILNGIASLDVTGKATGMTLSGTKVAGTLRDTTLTTQSTTTASSTASNTNNTIGGLSGSKSTMAGYYPYIQANQVETQPIDTSNLSVTGAISEGTVTGKATGTVILTTSGNTGIGGPVTVQPTPVPTEAVHTLDPGLGLTVCIAVDGVWPDQP